MTSDETDRSDAPDSLEAGERHAALRRGEEHARRVRDGESDDRDPHVGLADRVAADRAFAALAENVRDYAIFLMDADGVITFWGEGARLIKWWSKEQAEGAHLRLLYPAGGSEDGTAEAHLAAATEAGEYAGEGHRIRDDGSTFWAGVTLTALRDADGTLLGFVKVTRDLTALRAAEAVRRAALEAAEEASRIKSQFLATVSHEIRTPLTSVMAYTDLMKMEVAGQLSDGHHRYLDTIRSSSQHLLGLIEDILDLSRAEAGRIMVNRATVPVGRVLGQAVSIIEPQATQLGVDVVNASPVAAGDYAGSGDEERVRQILLNLLGNALKFTQAGGRVTVSAGMAADPPQDATLNADLGPWVYFRVEDTGPGIPNDRLDAIFDPFVQVDMSSTRQHGGTGLGLAISRRLARLMDGDVTVRSEPDIGSSFFLWLPSVPVDRTAHTPEPVEQPRPGADTLQEVRSVLLADIERILHTYVARLRSDPGTPRARELPENEVEDHLASFLADMAQTIAAIELAPGASNETVRDSTVIQRTIAHRHGSQRARLGWTEPELRREFEILSEELAAAVRRRIQRPRATEVDEAIGVLQEFVDRAEGVAITGHRRELRP